PFRSRRKPRIAHQQLPRFSALWFEWATPLRRGQLVLPQVALRLVRPSLGGTQSRKHLQSGGEPHRNGDNVFASGQPPLERLAQWPRPGTTANSGATDEAAVHCSAGF